MSYCLSVQSLPENHVSRLYHDHVYGIPVEEDHLLFERLVMEINQAGLSWVTILKKQDNFKIAFDHFDIEKIARYDKDKIAQLLQDKGIIRNPLKIKAVIYNAKIVLELIEKYGSFKAWLDFHHPAEWQDWVKLFKKTFTFTGPEIVREFLVSLAYLPGAHDAHCPLNRKC
jgi:DNA-3-methyladenine glycosylase I